VHKRHVFDFDKCCNMHQLDNVRGGLLRKYAGRQHSRSSVRRVPVGQLFVAKQCCIMHATPQLSCGHQADRRGNRDKRHGVHDVRAWHLLRRRTDCRSRMLRRHVGPRRQLGFAVRRENNVCSGHPRGVFGVSHHGPTMCILHIRNIQHVEQRLKLRDLEHVQRRMVRAHRGHELFRPRMRGMRRGNVYFGPQPNDVFATRKLRRRHAANGAGHVDFAANLRSVRIRHLLRGRRRQPRSVCHRDVGCRP
jgi:hypothetical protein